VASEGLAAHPVQYALKFGAVPAMRLRSKFLRQKRNILTEFVHAAPLINPVPLDLERRQLICGMEQSQSGDSYLWGTGSGCADPKFPKASRPACRKAFNVWLIR
jgi:hypothetical protein